jgi:hypothetical protein
VAPAWANCRVVVVVEAERVGDDRGWGLENELA